MLFKLLLKESSQHLPEYFLVVNNFTQENYCGTDYVLLATGTIQEVAETACKLGIEARHFMPKLMSKDKTDILHVSHCFSLPSCVTKT
jgi:hypothetical protein